MITSPKSYNPDSERAKLERGVEDLRITERSYAATVCTLVLEGHGDLALARRYARMSLAAGNGLLILLKRRLERR